VKHFLSTSTPAFSSTFAICNFVKLGVGGLEMDSVLGRSRKHMIATTTTTPTTDEVQAAGDSLFDKAWKEQREKNINDSSIASLSLTRSLAHPAYRWLPKGANQHKSAEHPRMVRHTQVSGAHHAKNPVTGTCGCMRPCQAITPARSRAEHTEKREQQRRHHT
jgi:hypothetical protein